ncbi:LysM peptidoglycan-binding domain-containing protein [Luteimonas aestuarii]|uniref:LysM peptidoglycan-binding domain-containing protein n=1 Tax=Luteimonas aestuarii TaxID=453837 RepID=A0A4R5U4Q9_9GAMM|nr:lytic transglycosylase domain-containing protein [Luteimonas aestuarii]TDK28718.1 LysM peptidoglycan-binding domain-containing protein [Luteimonas aestuarii]
MTRRHRWRRPLAILVLACLVPVALAAEPPAAPGAAQEDDTGTSTVLMPAGTRNGLEIYRKFREGLAEPECAPGDSERWRRHFAHAPGQFATPGTDVLPLFGYVVDALHEAYLPTEFALIPFVESGYRAGARSPSGPVGLWQFIATTARNHKVPIESGYDGRLSPVDSTQAAVRYLKTLHGMFAGDWRLAVMAYNAGEYRVLGALRRAGQTPANATPETLALPAITHAYVRKLHALSCLLEEAEEREAWLDSLDRPVALLAAVPAGRGNLDAFAQRHGLDAARLKRLNPAHANGAIASAPGRMLLAPLNDSAARLVAANTVPSPTPTRPSTATSGVAGFVNMAPPEPDPAAEATSPRTHTVARGESAWVIARRYGVRSDELLARNGLQATSVLRPGMVLQVDDTPPETGAAGVAE